LWGIFPLSLTYAKKLVIAGFIMIIFLFLGKSLLNLIGIDVNSFAVAGAFIIFFIALEMILGITLYKDDGHSAVTASVFSFSFPVNCRTWKFNNASFATR
jgi:multiple antibiotic resistance protein